MKTLPKGAYQIHQARLSGRKPAEMVLISTVGGLPGEVNPVVEVPDDQDPRQYEWRWLMGLQAALVFAESTKLTARVTLKEVLRYTPEAYLWRADLQKGWVVMGASDGTHLFRFMPGETRAFRGLGCS